MRLIAKLIDLFLKRQKQQPAERSHADNQEQQLTLQYVLEQFKDCSDLAHRSYPQIDTDIVYFDHLSGSDELSRDVIGPLTNVQKDEVSRLLKQSQYKKVEDGKQVIDGILSGEVAIFHQGQVHLINVYNPTTRNVGPSEIETVITGPHEGFGEVNEMNLSLIRRRLKSPRLKVKKLYVGEISRTAVCVLYIDGIVNPAYVEEMTTRIQNVEIDTIVEANMLQQLIDDNPNSIFPLFNSTERPDVIVSRLTAGRVAVLVDGSPTAISAPADFFEFFSSPDDYYLRWIKSSFIRLTRFTAYIITLAFTAFYVSVTTFHYEMIPRTMVVNLAESRSRVPFPPLYEALLMEFTIELLREAGARLPSKIGQTIGIVGGIVIGQAAVQAGFTSNILIIAVASSAIASFVVPSYGMSATIRILRFSLIFLAGIWGNLGLVLGLGLILIHLSSLTSLGSSYVTPIAPFNWDDLKDTFFRAPYKALRKRPSIVKSPNQIKEKMKK